MMHKQINANQRDTKDKHPKRRPPTSPADIGNRLPRESVRTGTNRCPARDKSRSPKMHQPLGRAHPADRLTSKKYERRGEAPGHPVRGSPAKSSGTQVISQGKRLPHRASSSNYCINAHQWPLCWLSSGQCKLAVPVNRGPSVTLRPTYFLRVGKGDA